MISHEQWPVDPGALVPFLIAVAFVEATPGPNMAYLAALSMAQGRRAGLAAVAGITAGLSVYMLASVAGVASVIAAAPGAYGLLRGAGVLCLLWLAAEAWRGADAARAPRGFAAPFWRGLSVNLLNPKAAVFYVTLLPGFIAPDHGPFAQQALILGASHIAVSILAHCAVVFAAAHLARYAVFAHSTAVRRGLAVAIGLTAVWLFWETRS
jgi:threonine/homoserine/homoserine lactone efflux protein